MQVLVQLGRLEARLPPMLGTDVNERTIRVWRRRWVEHWTVRDIAGELGWCPAAVEFHLRRAARILADPGRS